jgi:hypothetical protein
MDYLSEWVFIIIPGNWLGVGLRGLVPANRPVHLPLVLDIHDRATTQYSVSLTVFNLTNILRLNISLISHPLNLG